MKKKHLGFLVMALILVFSLAACSSGDPAPTTSSDVVKATPEASKEASGEDKASNDPVKLRIAWWGSQGRHDYTQQVIDLYVSKNPHVTIEPEFGNWDDYWQKLATQGASQSLPDVIQMDYGKISEYAERGQLIDLKPYLDNGTIDTTNIADTAIAGGMINGGLYGLNLGVNALGTAYNPEILELAGVEMPAIDWTWDQYEQLGYALQEKGYFLSGPPNKEEFFHYYLRTQGKTLFGADGKSIGYEDDQLFIDYFGRLQRLYDAGAIQSLDQAALITSWEEGLLASSEALLEHAWSNQYVGLAGATNKALEITSLPGPDSDKGLFMKPSMYFSIVSSSEQKEEAAKFLDFFTNDVEANKIIKGERGAPISSVIQEALRPELTDVQKNMFDYIAWATENSTPISPPPPVGAGEVYQTLSEVVDAVFYKQYTVEQGAAEFRKLAEDILSRN